MPYKNLNIIYIPSIMQILKKESDIRLLKYNYKRNKILKNISFGKSYIVENLKY